MVFVLVVFKLKLQHRNDLENIDQFFPALSDTNPVDLLLSGSEKLTRN